MATSVTTFVCNYIVDTHDTGGGGVSSCYVPHPPGGAIQVPGRIHLFTFGKQSNILCSMGGRGRGLTSSDNQNMDWGV